MIAVARTDYPILNRPRLAYLVLWVLCLTLIVALVSAPINGARRWVRLLGFTLQPSEPAKIGLVVVLAHQLAGRVPDDIKGLLRPVATMGLLGALILMQPDLGTASLLAVIGGVLLFVAGMRLAHIGVLAGIAAPLFVGAVLTAEYRLARVLTFLDPFADPLGNGFQLTQSLIALGSGGLTGVGFTASRQKLLYLPEPYSDFIFSVIGEELGFVGAFLVVAGEFWIPRNAVEHQIAQLGLEQVVILRDRYVPDTELAQYLQAAAVLCAPYRHNTGSGVLAAAYGFPLALVRTGTPEQARPAEGLFVARPGDTADLAVQLLQALAAGTDYQHHRDPDQQWQQLATALLGVQMDGDQGSRHRTSSWTAPIPCHGWRSCCACAITGPTYSSCSGGHRPWLLC